MPRAWARNDRSTELEQTTAQQKAVPIAESKNMDHFTAELFRTLGVTSDTATGISCQAREKPMTATVKSLVKRGAHINGKTLSGYTPIMVAVMNDDQSDVRLLLDLGANVNATGPSDTTPLILATESSNEAVMTILLNRGANVNAHDQWGVTSLLYAVQKANLGKVRLLLDHKAVPNYRNSFGHTALDEANNAPSPHQDIIDLLKAHGGK